MDDQLRHNLDELEATIAAAQADGQIDDEERAQLRELLERVRGDLDDAEEERGGLAQQLEESAVRFEGDHPTIAAAIRSAVHTLTGYGI